MTDVSKYEKELTKKILECRAKHIHYDSLVWCEQCQTWHVSVVGDRILCTVSPDCGLELTHAEEVSHG